MKVASVQCAARLGDAGYNLQHMLQCIERVMELEPETELILFPELILSGYMGDRALFERLAETVPSGRCMMRLAQAAKKHMVGLFYGFPERDAWTPGHLYDSVLYIDKTGK